MEKNLICTTIFSVGYFQAEYYINLDFKLGSNINFEPNFYHIKLESKKKTKWQCSQNLGLNLTCVMGHHFCDATGPAIMIRLTAFGTKFGIVTGEIVFEYFRITQKRHDYIRTDVLTTRLKINLVPFRQFYGAVTDNSDLLLPNNGSINLI